MGLGEATGIKESKDGGVVWLPGTKKSKERGRMWGDSKGTLFATIAEIWTKLIDPARPIGRADKFFEMGGHSLLALRALRQMEHQLGVKLDFRALLQESLADIATRCRSERIPEGGGDSGAARPAALHAETELKDRVL